MHTTIIFMKKVVIIEGARLSARPGAKTMVHPRLGMVNVTDNGRMYYRVDVLAEDGLSFKTKGGTIWVDENQGVSIERYNQLRSGKETAGYIKKFEVAEYSFPDRLTGAIKTAKTVELLVLGNQTEDVVLQDWLDSQERRNTTAPNDMNIPTANNNAEVLEGLYEDFSSATTATKKRTILAKMQAIDSTITMESVVAELA